MNLLHLRARWYNVETGTFLSRDAVESEPPYVYVRGNPVNWVDPSGAFPEFCRDLSTKEAYAHCLKLFYHLSPAYKSGIWDLSEVEKVDCKWSGPVPYIASGYIEGWNGLLLIGMGGEEIVYDFATMQRHKFTYQGFGSGAENHIIAVGGTAYFGIANGFKSSSNIEDDYKGPASSLYLGIGQKGLGIGLSYSMPLEGGEITVAGAFIGLGISLKPPAKLDLGRPRGGLLTGDGSIEELPVDISQTLLLAGLSGAIYNPEGELHEYAPKDDETGTYTLVDSGQLIKDIYFGVYSPVLVGGTFMAPGQYIAVANAMYYAWLHDEIYVESGITK